MAQVPNENPLYSTNPAWFHLVSRFPRRRVTCGARGFCQSATKNVKSKRRFAWCIECGSTHGTPMDGRETKMLAHVMSAQCRRSAAEKAFYSQSVVK
jgi:hypothetical protein